MSPSISPSDDFADNPIGHADTVVLDDGYGPRIVVSKALLARIFAQVDAGVRILPRGGAEIGGLLVGSSGQGDDFAQGNDLLVEEVVPLKIDYQFGPMFRMSPVDLDNVEKAMVAVHEDEAKTVVGFYRSLTRGDDKLRESDAEILEAIRQIHPSFADFQCFFVLAPLSRFEISLCVFVRNGNSWEHSQKITLQTETPQSGIVASKPAAPKLVQELPPTLQAPLIDTRPTAIQDVRSSGLSAAASAKPAPIVRQTEEPAVTVARQPPVNSIAASAVPKPSRGVGRQSAIAIYASIGLACILAVVGVLRWIDSKSAPAPVRQTESAPATPHMGFAANWVGSTWKLTWDRDAVDALKPVGATLTIQDGANQQQIELTAADLSSGELYYNPQTAELAFRLEVQRNGAPPADERVRVLAGVKPVNRVPQTSWQPASAKEPAATAGLSPNVAPNVGATAASSTAAKTATPTPPRVANLPSNSTPKEVAAVSAASIPAPPVTVLALPILPVLNSAVNLPDAPAPPPAQVSTAAPPTPQQSKQAPPASAGTPLPISAATTSSASTSATNTSRPPTPVPSTYVGPKPTKQATPMAPQGGVTTGQTQVAIRVAIDAKGKVTKVTPVGGNLNIALVSAAAKAAEFWEFDPAKDNGRPVASEMTLIFRF